jgi:SOS-response transcriptional repressor LexA
MMSAAVSLPPLRPLTERQAMVLDYIRSYRRERGIAPTMREIGRALGIRSTNGVADHLRVLEHKGYLAKRRDDDFRRTRAIVVAYEPPEPEDARAVLTAENVKLRSLLRYASVRLEALTAAAKDADDVLNEIRRVLGKGADA